MTTSDPDIDLDKDINVDYDLDFDSDFDIDFDKDVDIDVKVDSDVDLDGNFAQFTFDAQAHGTDTLVEVDVSVLTIEGELSSVIGSIVSAAD